MWWPWFPLPWACGPLFSKCTLACRFRLDCTENDLVQFCQVHLYGFSPVSAHTMVSWYLARERKVTHDYKCGFSDYLAG
jgi:hypothetical protein